MSEALNNNFTDPAISRSGVKLERDYALVDARDKIWELGEQIELRLHEEGTIERDRLGNIVRRITNSNISYLFYAFPIIQNPTVEQVETAGLREKTELIVYTAMLDWMLNNINLDRLQSLNMIKMSVIINGAKYEIKDKNWHSEFSDTHLYITLGLNRI